MKKGILFLLVFVLLSNLVLAITITDNAETDLIFTEKKLNDPSRKEAIITFDNPKDQILTKDKLIIDFDEVCGKVKDYKILEYKTIEIQKEVPQYTLSQVCDTYTDNKTKELVETCSLQRVRAGTITQTEYISDWFEIDEISAETKDYKIKADIIYENCGDGMGYKVDWKPYYIDGLKQYVKDEWAWWNTTFKKCRNFTMNNNVNKILYNKTVMLNITNTENMSSDLKDLRILDTYCNNSGSELNYEITKQEGNSAILLFKVPQLDIGNNWFSLLYNNSNAESGENKAGTYDHNYVFAWVMKDNNSNSVNDSTGNNHHGIKRGSNVPIEKNGWYAKNQYFMGDADIQTQDSLSMFDGTSEITVELWANSTGINTYDTLVGITNNGVYRIGVETTGNWFITATGGNKDTGVTADESKHFHGVAYDGSNSTWVLDSDKILNSAHTLDKGDDGVHIGSYAEVTDSWEWTGNIEYVWVSNVSRSIEWRNYTYQIFENQDTLVTIYPEITLSETVGNETPSNTTTAETQKFGIDPDLTTTSGVLLFLGLEFFWILIFLLSRLFPSLLLSVFAYVVGFLFAFLFIGVHPTITVFMVFFNIVSMFIEFVYGYGG